MMSEVDDPYLAPPEEDRWWATTVQESVEEAGEHGTTWSVRSRLVVVPAPSAEAARMESGLPDSFFHEASDEELTEWEALTSRPLNEEDVGMLLRLVRASARETAKRSVRNRERVGPKKTRDALRFKARMLAELAGKLEAIATEEEL